MQKIRLLNKPEDYKRLGVKHHVHSQDLLLHFQMERCIRMSHFANQKKCGVQRKNAMYILQKTG